MSQPALPGHDTLAQIEELLQQLPNDVKDALVSYRFAVRWAAEHKHDKADQAEHAKLVALLRVLAGEAQTKETT